jgi:orotate phosphoribosyltransferase
VPDRESAGADRSALAEAIARDGLTRFEEPVRLASGAWSREFIDAKRALATGERLELACRELLSAVAGVGLEFDAIGGLTMGADAFAHVTAVLAGRSWFVVRKTPKGRGTNKLVEGAALDAATRVLLVDDVVTTGGSLVAAYEAVIRESDARVVGAVSIVDRGMGTRKKFAELGVPYLWLLSYEDLGIEPVAEPEDSRAAPSGSPPGEGA